MNQKRILIANRGEIALRVIRSAKEMGLHTIAVYSDADEDSLHVKRADESYYIGGSLPAESYRNLKTLVNAAVDTNADLVHPGYGFLAENADFAKAIEKKGIIWVGPRPETISSMGDKIESRKLVSKIGLQPVPGQLRPSRLKREAMRDAESFGYPVALKAAHGGGGKGLRIVHSEKELLENFEIVKRESEAYFGSDQIYVEKFIKPARHVETQVLADKYGNILYLGERDCSLQRRNQKLIEIAPSPQLNDEQREYIGALAVKAAKAVNYENAGTVEFLLDKENNFYFMEMNTRLQVEHTITESITGIDIVQKQIKIASGEKLRYKQEDISFRGFAIEFRINAEDPKQDFLPSFGKITRYFAAGGPGVRTDASIYTGYVIPPYYDSMCAKLTIWALNWEDAVQRGLRALDDIGVFGVKTTIPYYQEILKHEDFVQGDFNTSFVEMHPELTDYEDELPPDIIAAAIGAAIAAHEGI